MRVRLLDALDDDQLRQHVARADELCDQLELQSPTLHGIARAAIVGRLLERDLITRHLVAEGMAQVELQAQIARDLLDGAPLEHLAALVGRGVASLASSA